MEKSDTFWLQWWMRTSPRIKTFHPTSTQFISTKNTKTPPSMAPFESSRPLTKKPIETPRSFRRFCRTLQVKGVPSFLQPFSWNRSFPSVQKVKRPWNSTKLYCKLSWTYCFSFEIQSSFSAFNESFNFPFSEDQFSGPAFNLPGWTVPCYVMVSHGSVLKAVESYQWPPMVLALMASTVATLTLDSLSHKSEKPCCQLSTYHDYHTNKANFNTYNRITVKCVYIYIYIILY